MDTLPLLCKKIDIYAYELLELSLIYFMYIKCDECICFFVIGEITPRSLVKISSVLVRLKEVITL